MKRWVLTLLSCAMVFVVFVTVSAASNSSLDDVKKEVFLDMTSRSEELVIIDKANKEIIDSIVAIAGSDNSVSDTATQTDENDGEGIISDAKNEDEKNGSGIVDSPVEPGTNEMVEKQEESNVNNSKVSEKINLKFNLLTTDIKTNLLLVNKKNLLVDKFIPKGLVNVSPKLSYLKIPPKKSGIMLSQDALTALNNMYAAAYKAGVRDMVLSSGYRSYREQNILFSRKVSSLIRSLGRNAAENKASTVVARPGSSEHQTGLAIDVTIRPLLKRKDPLVAEFANTTCGKWMARQAWKYGFIMRYKQEKIKITGIIDEPWHYRYVGSPHAEVINKYGYCLEEYENFLKNKSHINFTDISNNEYEIAYVTIPKGVSVINVAADKGSSVEISRVNPNGVVVTVKKPGIDT